MYLMKLLFLILVGLVSLKTYAFKFTPMVSQIDLVKDKGKQKFTVLNNSEQTIAVQIRAAHRRVDEKGIEFRKEAKDDFLIFPNQLFLKGNERRSILVRYKGDPKIEKELPFRIIAEQIDVDAKDVKKLQEGASLRILLRYVASLYVTKGNFKGDIKFSDTKVDLKQKLVSVLAENIGKKHVVLDNLNVRVLKGKKELYAYKVEELKGFHNEVVQALAKRIFEFPLNKTLPTDGSIKFEISY